MPHGGAFPGNCCSLLQEMKAVFVVKRLKKQGATELCVHNIVIIFSIAPFFIQMSKYFMYIKIL